MNDAITAIIFQVLKQAEAQGFRYPLHVTVEDADGEKQMVFEFPAPGEIPTLIHSILDPDSDTSGFPSPVTLVTRDSTPDKPKEIRLQIQMEIADDASCEPSLCASWTLSFAKIAICHQIKRMRVHSMWLESM